jgi:hypothetical protein
MVAGYRELLEMKIRLIGAARFELTTSSSSTASRTCGSKVGALKSGHQKLSQNRGSLHQFENRRAEPVRETILIGTLAHTRPFATKLDAGCLTAATFAAPFRLPSDRNLDGKQNVRVAPI